MKYYHSSVCRCKHCLNNKSCMPCWFCAYKIMGILDIAYWCLVTSVLYNTSIWIGCPNNGVQFNPYAVYGLFDQYKMMQKKLKNDWNPGKWALIWEYLARTFQWIQTWKGLNGFQKSVCPCALVKSSLSIERVNERRLQGRLKYALIKLLQY